MMRRSSRRFGRMALQAVADCFEDIGAVLIWRRENGGFGTIVSPGLSAAHADYEANWQHDMIRGRSAVLNAPFWLRATSLPISM